MPVSINGNTGVITGLAVGGLPDGTVDADSLASNAVTAGKLASGVGGKILQVKQAVKTDTASQGSTSNSYVDISGLSETITTTGSNKVFISFNINGGTEGGYAFFVRIARVTSGTTTGLCVGDAASNRVRCTTGGNSNHAGWESFYQSAEFLDSPSAGTHTYKIQWSTGTPVSHSPTMYINRSYTDTDYAWFGRGTSQMTIMEVSV
jgi:hypothetical protein